MKMMSIIFVIASFFANMPLNLFPSNIIDNEFYSLSSMVYLHRGPNRLGDTLIRYCTDKYTAFHMHLPLFYDPFEYSDQLMLSEIDLSTDKYALPTNDKWLGLPFYDLSKNNFSIETNTFYFGQLEDGYLTFEMIKEMKKDTNFMHELRKAIAPKQELDLIFPPKNIISVAVHIRKGIIYDGPLQSKQIIDPLYKHLDVRQTYFLAPYSGFDIGHPLKVPPEQYYIDQIKKMSELFNFQPLYVYIFTDDPDPIGLMDRIRQAVNVSNIIFDCRKEPNRHDQNVLIDLFSMCNFNCLIRPRNSAYSIIATLINDYMIVVYPNNYKWIDGYLNMEDIRTEIDVDKFNQFQNKF